MNEHAEINDLLPFYAAGTLDEKERRRVESHLPDCAGCREDLALWEDVGGEVTKSNRSLAAPPELVNLALEQVKAKRAHAPRLRWVYDLLRIQSTLVRGEIWPASTAVMLLGCIVAWMSGSTVVIRLLTPMVAAASLATIYGPENDPGMELAAAAPTSPRQILLARMALVFGFNLILTVLVSLVMIPILPVGAFGALILSWLAPMTFLSAAALVLSMWIGTGNAVAVSYLGWLAYYITASLTRIPDPSPVLQRFFAVYQQFWTNSGLLFAFALLLGIVAVWKAGRSEMRLPNWA